MQWLLQMTVLYAALHSEAAPATFHAVDLDEYPLARCLDGSPGAYYFWPATSLAASKKWVIHHVGGGWCSTDVPDTESDMVNSCYERSFSSLGSSNASFYPRDAAMGWTIWTHEGEQTMQPDPSTNPLMHDWNKAALVYCDGGSFSGRKFTPTSDKGRQLYFRGSYIREAIVETLLLSHGLADASEVVIGGGSAGGLAAILHLDQWRSAIPATSFVVGLPDSGFFLDWSLSKPATASYSYAHELRSLLFAFNASAGLNQACVAARTADAGDVSECFFCRAYCSIYQDTNLCFAKHSRLVADSR